MSFIVTRIRCEAAVYPTFYRESRQRINLKLVNDEYSMPATYLKGRIRTKERHNNQGKVQLFPALMLALLAGSAGIWMALQSSPKESPLETVQRSLQSALIFPEDFKSVPAFSLLDQDKKPTTQESLQGHWNLVFFGFTHCPDVCPLTLSVVRDVAAKIAADDSLPDPKVTFVTVDPKRDTPEKLNQYLAFFNPEFSALTGELNAVYELTRPMNIVVQFTANDENPSAYTVDHTASIFLIDPELRVRGSFKVPHETETILSDYRIMLNHLAPKS